MADSIKASFRWAAKNFELEMPATATGKDLQQRVFELTGVPVDRQRISIANFSADAEVAKLKLPRSNMFVVFGVVPKTSEQIADESRAVVSSVPARRSAPGQDKQPQGPPGLRNDEGENVCYMNSCIQLLRTIPALSRKLYQYKHQQDDGSSIPENLKNDYALTSGLSELWRNINMARLVNRDEGLVDPEDFIDLFRHIAPHFSQKDETGNSYMQQDASEALLVLLSSLTISLQMGPSDRKSWIENYMTTKTRRTSTVTDEGATDEPVVEHDSLLNLSCFIQDGTNHLTDGLKISLNDTADKQSDSLGRNAVWSRSTEFTRLPRFLLVQFIRFHMKRVGTEVRCTKVLRKVTFPLEFDAAEFCEPDLKRRMQPIRDAVREYRSLKLQLSREKKRKLDGKGHQDDHAEIEKSIDKTGQKIKALLAADEKLAADSGNNPSGIYDLTAIVTHNGRTPNEGHYIGWSRDEEDPSRWWKCDDHKISPVGVPQIEALSGGTVGNIAYILLFRAAEFPGLEI